MKNKILVVANWKANPESLKLAKDIFSGIKKASSKYKNVETVVCPPVIYLESLKNNVLKLGAQDFFWERGGAFTGFVGYESLLETKIKYAIIGHSERRALGEDNKNVAKKLAAALASHVTPIICVGELTRDANLEYLDFIKTQIAEAFSGVPKTRVKDVVVAYEPVWAIGKNAKRDAKPREVEEVAILIKRIVGDIYKTKSVPPIKILYGGSVNPGNAEELLTKGAIDGFLVGGASLDAKKFGEILEIANNFKK